MLDKSDQLPLTFVQYGLIALGYPIADPAGILDGADTTCDARVPSLDRGTADRRPDPREILDVVLTAAAIGDQHAETAVGVMTASGIGLEQDDQVARLWLRAPPIRAIATLRQISRCSTATDAVATKDIAKARSLLQAAVEPRRGRGRADAARFGG